MLPKLGIAPIYKRLEFLLEDLADNKIFHYDPLMNSMNFEPFQSLIDLYGIEAIEKLTRSHILIVGIGGVGSWAAESLARSAVGKISLVDMDEVCTSNINRQIHALNTTVGKSKVQLMAERIKQINPNCQVQAINDFFTSRTADEILTPPAKITYVVDAIDSLKNKCLLISKCKESNIPLITVGGAGGKRKAENIQICDLAHSYDDSLLFRVRKNLRKNYGFTKYTKKKFKIDCVFSPEIVESNVNICSHDNDKKNCDNGLGSACFVTASFGLLAAGYIVNKITAQDFYVC